MSSDTWKLEKDLCRCCHSEGSFKNLAEPSETTDLFEIYADMLNECFSIDMAPVPGLLSAATYTICEVCVIRLRDAADFKKQVLTCEERFKDLYNRNGIKMAAPTVEIEIKQEIIDSEPEGDLKIELSQSVNAPDVNAPDVNAPDFNAPEDDDFSLDSLSDMKMSEDEKEKPTKVKVVKKRKIQARKTVKCKTSKKTKKKAKEEPAEEDKDVEKKKGRVQAVQIRTTLKIDEDYNKVGEIYTCARCEKSYDNLKTLREHVKKKHYKIPHYKCSICNDRFMNPVPVTIHKLKVHNVDVRVKCSLCNKLFNIKAQLTKHIRNFHMLGEVGKRYKCELCDYETFKTEYMHKHKFVHKTVKNYHCRFCKKSFMRKSTLNFHEKIHTGDRRKVCTECGQAFVQKASLNYHMTKYHPEVNF